MFSLKEVIHKDNNDSDNRLVIKSRGNYYVHIIKQLCVYEP